MHRLQLGTGCTSKWDPAHVSGQTTQSAADCLHGVKQLMVPSTGRSSYRPGTEAG